MDLNKAIKSRKSIRHFSTKKPSWKDIIECIDSARFAPMAGNLFPLRFILVSDKDKIQKLADASQQPFVSEAQYIVVVCSDCKMVLNAYEERAEKFCRQEAGAAIQNFLLKLEEKGLKTCWVGYFIDYLIKEALKIPKDVEVEAIFPIGYESKKQGTKPKSKKRKKELDDVLFFDTYKNKRMKKKESIEA
jgi:nitroreductase